MAGGLATRYPLFSGPPPPEVRVMKLLSNGALWSVLLLGAGYAGAQQRVYLYAISCNDVVKLDTATAKQVSTLELFTRTALDPQRKSANGIL